MFYLGSFHTNYIISRNVENFFNYFFKLQFLLRKIENLLKDANIYIYIYINMWNLEINHYSTLKCLLNDMLLQVLFTISYIWVRMGE